jgi:hypothetical protein
VAREHFAAHYVQQQPDCQAAHSTHPKGEHSKGSLIHDHVGDVLIVGNLYAHNYERSPLFKGGARGLIVNNLTYDPGPRALHYNLIAEEWRGHAFETGRMVAVGNVLRAGPSTPADLAFMMLGGSGDLEWYAEDTIAFDRPAARCRCSVATRPEREADRIAGRRCRQGSRSPRRIPRHVIRAAGARPWDRDAIDARIVANVIEGRGEIIDSETDVGGYPAYAGTREVFDPAAWDLRYMTRK